MLPEHMIAISNGVILCPPIVHENLYYEKKNKIFVIQKGKNVDVDKQILSSRLGVIRVCV